MLANEPCETKLTRQLRAGVTHVLLPETPEQLSAMLETLAVKEIKLPRVLLNGFLNMRLVLLDEHKKGNNQNCEAHRRTLSIVWMYQSFRHSSNTTIRIWKNTISV